MAHTPQMTWFDPPDFSASVNHNLKFHPTCLQSLAWMHSEIAENFTDFMENYEILLFFEDSSLVSMAHTPQMTWFDPPDFSASVNHHLNFHPTRLQSDTRLDALRNC